MLLELQVCFAILAQEHNDHYNETESIYISASHVCNVYMFMVVSTTICAIDTHAIHKLYEL